MATTESALYQATEVPRQSSAHPETECHSVQFYAQDSALIHALEQHIAPSLTAGGAAVVIATKPHREAITQRLKQLGLQPASAAKQGRYVALDAQQTLSYFMVNDWPEATRFRKTIEGIMTAARASADVEVKFALFGEMVALLWAQGKPQAAIALEQLWNDLSRDHSFALLCAYPIQEFQRESDGAAFLNICSEHSHVVPAESYTGLANEQDRMRSISYLQQQSQALGAEVSERKKTQGLLQRREAELADFLENAVEGVQCVGPEQNVLWANRALLKILGYSQQEYAGHKLSDFFVHYAVFQDFWQRLMQRETIQNFAADLRCKDGSVRNMLIQSNGLWENGQFVHTRCFLRDDTAHRRAEQALRLSQERLKLTQQAAGIGSWELDLESDTYYCSEEAAAMLGLPKGVGACQNLLARMYYSGDREQFMRSLRTTSTRNKDLEAEFRVSRNGRNVRWLSARGRTFYNQGKPILLGVLVDVTAAKAAENKKSRRARAS